VVREWRSHSLVVTPGSSSLHSIPLSTWNGGASDAVGEKEKQGEERTYLLVGLAQCALFERLANVFATAREEPRALGGVVHDEDFTGGRLDDDHARAKQQVLRPEAAVRYRRRREVRVLPRFESSTSAAMATTSGATAA
jgi:hypothetical protein